MCENFINQRDSDATISSISQALNPAEAPDGGVISASKGSGKPLMIVGVS